jgi:hypothetical protein
MEAPGRLVPDDGRQEADRRIAEMSSPPKASKDTRPFSALDPCEQLAVITDTLMSVASGRTSKIVRHDTLWKETHMPSVTWLQAERTRLEKLCKAHRGLPTRQSITMGRSPRW